MKPSDSDDLLQCWFHAAVLVDHTRLTPIKIFRPRSAVRIGHASDNDFVVPELDVASTQVVSDGVMLHLAPHSEVRMSGRRGEAFQVYSYDPARPIVRVTVHGVAFRVAENLTMYIRYHRTRWWSGIARGVLSLAVRVGLTPRAGP